MTDINSAKQAAKRLFRRVSYQDGPLGSYQLSSLLSQTYQILNIPFKPTQNDIKLYQQTLDADKDGKVTLKDLQARAVQYLCSNNLIATISPSSVKSQGLNQKTETNNYQRKQQQNLEVANFAKSSYSQSSQANSFSQSQYSQYSQAVQNSYQYSTDKDVGAYNYNYKSSFQNVKPQISSQYPSNYLSDAYSKNSLNSYSVSNVDQPSDRSYEHGSTSSNVNQSYGITNNKYDYSNNDYQQQERQQQYSHEQEQQQYGEEDNSQQQEKLYSENVRQYLSIVGQVFMAYADPVEYTVTQADVQGLLRDTYAVLGRQGYEPSYEDVQTWMKLCDVNQDGKVQYQEYQYFVVKSLERSGLRIYD